MLCLISYICVTLLSSLTAWSVVVCCEVDAVFWTPGCENKKEWREDLEKEKGKKIESTFFNISKLSEFKWNPLLEFVKITDYGCGSF